MELTTPISALTRVGKTTAGRLKSLGLNTVEDLLFYFPFRYEDFSLVKKISELVPGEPVTVRAKVQMIATRRSWRKRKILTEALVGDETGSIKAVWFNQPFISKVLRVGDELFLSGQLDELRMEMISPDYEKVRVNADTVHTARIVPIYHLTQDRADISSDARRDAKAAALFVKPMFAGVGTSRRIFARCRDGKI